MRHVPSGCSDSHYLAGSKGGIGPTRKLYSRLQVRWVCTVIASIALFGVAIGCSSAQGPVANANRDYELFVCAMEVVSTAPSYVLITVVDGRSGNEQQVAILSNDLRSALWTEYGLPDLDPWEAKA